jgi:hypothetical protein
MAAMAALIMPAAGNYEALPLAAPVATTGIPLMAV